MLNICSLYRRNISQAYRPISNYGKMIETAHGPIQYTEFGEGHPMLFVHGAGGGYDQGEYFGKLIGGKYRWIAPSRFGFRSAPDDTLVAFEQAEFTARNIRGTQFIPMEKGGHLALMLKSNTSAKEYVLNFLDQYNNPELTGLPTMKIKGDLVCGN